MSRVGIETLVFLIPGVCKSWYSASLDPTCWQNLIFPELYIIGFTPNPLMSRFAYEHGHNGLTEFIKFEVDRSQSSANLLQLPSYRSEQAFEYVSNRCPALNHLNLPLNLIDDHGNLVSKAIGNWKNLEVFTLRSGHMFSKILTQIIHCRRLVALNCSSFRFGDKEALAIVELIPNIKKLIIEYSGLPQENLVKILRGCKGIEVLDLSTSLGFKVDYQILELASNIKTFKCKGSS